MSAKDFLGKLSEASGVSGYEHAIRDLVIDEFRPWVDEISVTKMGSIVALKRGPRNGKGKAPNPKLLIEGHMDEIGLMVTDIDHGFLRFTQVGGFDVRVLVAQEVTVHAKKELRGIIGSRPPHVLTEEERKQVIPMRDLFVDVGLPEEDVHKLVQVGDLITIHRKMLSLNGNLVSGKAFDDRAALVAIAEGLRHLSTAKHSCDVYAVANVQEEIGLRGAETSAFQINPDIAIAIDVTHAEQPNGSEINAVPLNAGMGIAMGPNMHPRVHQKLTEVAKANEIPYQVTAYSGATGTNAWAMQVVREGIPTALIEVPLRYMHTSVETISVGDLERIGRLLSAFAASVDSKFLAELRGEELENKSPESTRKPRKARRARRGSRRGRNAA
jgi:tetrahedral aminopeptidase